MITNSFKKPTSQILSSSINCVSLLPIIYDRSYDMNKNFKFYGVNFFHSYMQLASGNKNSSTMFTGNKIIERCSLTL